MGWVNTAGVGASAFFAFVGYQLTTRVIPVACNEATVGMVVAGNIAAGAPCVGAILIAGVGVAVNAMMAANGAANGWQWWKGSADENTTKRAQLYHFSEKVQGSNITLHGGTAHTSHIYEAMKDIYPDMLDNVEHMGVMYGQVPDVQTLEADVEPHYATWSYNATDHLKTVIVPNTNVNETIEKFKSYRTGIALQMIDESEGPNWFSFNSYGGNMDLARQNEADIHADAQRDASTLGNDVTQIKQYPSGEQLLQSYEKLCLSWGDNPARGVDSIIVGEVYWGGYGGIDGKCQDG